MLRFSSICKLVAAFVVMSMMSFAGLLYYHLKVRPLRGVFERFFPTEADVLNHKEAKKLLAKVDSPLMPEVDPGAVAYGKAEEVYGRGLEEEAREILGGIVRDFPDSKSAVKAREYLSSWNLRDLFDVGNLLGKSEYVVPRGGGYLSVAAKNQTTLANLMALNGMVELRGPQPGERLMVMPLNFRVVIDVRRRVLILEKDGKFLCQYGLMEGSDFGQLKGGVSVLDGREGFSDVLLARREVRAGAGAKVVKGVSGEEGRKEKAEAVVVKSIRVKQGFYQIRGVGLQKDVVKLAHTLYVSAADLEELNLLTRNGNEVVVIP